MKHTILALALGLSTVGSIAHAGNGDIGSVGIAAITEYECTLVLKNDNGAFRSIAIPKVQSAPAQNNKVEGRMDQYEVQADNIKAMVNIRQWVLNSKHHTDRFIQITDITSGFMSQSAVGDDDAAASLIKSPGAKESGYIAQVYCVIKGL